MRYDCRGYEFILYKQSRALSPVIKEVLLASFVTLLHSYILLKGHSLLLIDVDEKLKVVHWLYQREFSRCVH